MHETRKVGEMNAESDLAKIESQWAPLYDLLKDERALARRAPAVSAWGVAEQLGHVALVLDFIGARIEDLLADPAKNAGDDVHPFARRILPSGEIPRGVGDAPDGVQMLGATVPTIRPPLDRGREKWRSLSGRAAAVAASPSRYPHHRLGMLTSAQWARFIAIHNAHHLRIIDDILAAPEDR